MISLLSAIFLIFASIITYMVKSELDQDPICPNNVIGDRTYGRTCWIAKPLRLFVTIVGFSYYILFTFILYKFLMAGIKLIPQYFSDKVAQYGSYFLLVLITLNLFIINTNCSLFLNGSIGFYFAVFEAKDGNEDYKFLVNFLHVNGEIAYFLIVNLLIVLFYQLARIQKQKIKEIKLQR